MGHAGPMDQMGHMGRTVLQSYGHMGSHVGHAVHDGHADHAVHTGHADRMIHKIRRSCEGRLSEKRRRRR